jgi:hypothetical protein
VPSIEIHPPTADPSGLERVRLGERFVGKATNLFGVDPGAAELLADRGNNRVWIAAVEVHANIGVPRHVWKPMLEP